MRIVNWLYYNLLYRWRGGNERYVEKLERENREMLGMGRKRRTSKDNVQNVKSKYEFDLIHGDDTAGKMMLQ